MRIGFDIGPISTARSGVGNYCLHLLRELLQMDGLDLSGFAASVRQLDLAALGRPLPHRHLPIPTRLMYKVWSVFGAPKVDSLLGGVDIYHATNYFLPPVKRAKRVLTIHDIAFKKHPELCSPKIVGPFSEGVAGFARAADAVIADSESTRRDIIEMLGVRENRVHTVHLAVEDGLAPMPREEARKIAGRKNPYLLFVSTIEPRKNVQGIIKAFERIQDDFPHDLMLAGARGWMPESFWRELSGHSARILTPGFVAQRDMRAVFSAADAFVFPSYYEGFGLPVLEAMACGCPVITANNSSLPEVAGDAAEYCDANDIDSIANAMRRVLSDSALRESMSQRGLAQAAKFSWKKTAEQTAAVYRSVRA